MEVPKLEDYQVTLKSLSLFQHLKVTIYSGQEVMPYMKSVHVPMDNIENTRFTVENLNSLFA